VARPFPGKTLLDVAAVQEARRCGSPLTGCSVTGIDVHGEAVATAVRLQPSAAAERAKFRSIDATGPLPFSDDSFDVITCIDAINHFPTGPLSLPTGPDY
jgi:2-polyprenyl-3-methyl-5-hydroxy-6-metoxy-1,4-benzoquinol methylase